MNDKPINKAMIAALALLIFAAALIVGIQRSRRSAADAGATQGYSDASTPPEAFVPSVRETTSAEPETETTTEPEPEPETETTTASQSSTLKAQSSTTTTEAYVEDDYEYQDADAGAGDYIGYYELTAYEWTGDPMADGQYPYYGAVACNSLPLGTWIYIEGYGTFQVCDRGGIGMGNNVIDIYLGDPYVCEQFGRRGANVFYAD